MAPFSGSVCKRSLMTLESETLGCAEASGAPFRAPEREIAASAGKFQAARLAARLAYCKTLGNGFAAHAVEAASKPRPEYIYLVSRPRSQEGEMGDVRL